MTKDQLSIIRKTQAVLSSIESGNLIAFNVLQYEKLGLVKSSKKWAVNAYGNKVVIGHKFSLTAKGRRVLSIII